MNQKVTALIARAQAALKGQPPLGGSVLVDFGSDGHVYIDAANVVNGTPPAEVDCTITLSLSTLDALESGSESIVWAMIDGDVTVDGDRDLAERFGKIVQSAQG
jgi:putative sterol carrier protein